MRGDAVLAADPALQKQLDAYVEHSKVACRLPLLGVDKGLTRSASVGPAPLPLWFM